MLKLADKGTPACRLAPDDIMAYHLKHGYNFYDEETGKWYADFSARSRMSSQANSTTDNN